MNQLHAMRVFMQVADSGGFAAAARELNASPAVVTRLVAELEEDLGARLLHRTTRRVALTDVGEDYLERVRQILADVDDAAARAGAAVSEPRGHLRVLAPPAFAVHQLAKHLVAFRGRHPQISIELQANGPVETMDETYDVTLIQVGLRPLVGDFIARRLARTEVIVCAAPEYLERRGRPSHPSELVQHEAMLPTATREVTFHRGAPGSATASSEVITLRSQRPALTSSHLDVMYAAALHGLGIAGLPSFVVEDALRERALERVLPAWRLFAGTLYAAMPTRKHVPARTRAFVDFLVETFGGRDEDPWLVAAACPTTD